MNLEVLSATRPVVRGLGDSFDPVTEGGVRLGDQRDAQALEETELVSGPGQARHPFPGPGTT